jgi:hypothetical protein
MSPLAHEVLRSLIDEGLIDEYYQYRTDFRISAAENEFQKRRIGLDLAIKSGATHFLLMDADEFYKIDEFTRAKELIEKEDIGYSCVDSYFYIRQPEYRSKYIDTTKVCFISKICKQMVFDLNGSFPEDCVDPTRRITIKNGKYFKFSTSEIAMHHYAFIRVNMNSKLANSSNRGNLEFMEKASIALRNWRFPAVLSFPNKPTMPIILVKDEFNQTASTHVQRSNLRNVHANPIEKRIALICTLRLTMLAGSELVCYELSEYLVRNNFRVLIYTNLIEPKIEEMFSNLGKDITIITNPNDLGLVESYSHLSMCWIQHQQIPSSLVEYIINGKRKPLFIFNHMSFFESFEWPIAYQAEAILADLVLFNSSETFDFQRNYFPVKYDRFMLFQNPAPKRYYDAYDQYEVVRIDSGIKIRNIAIISNHVPEELLSVADELLRYGITTNYIGKNRQLNVLITPELLMNYDVVVTIGKTVQYCICMAKSVYIYDYMGGDGYLTPENFADNEYHNFSGRPYSKKKAKAIVLELLKGYEANIEFMKVLRRDHEIKFNLDHVMDRILNSDVKIIEVDMSIETRFSLLALQGYSQNLHNTVVWIESDYNSKLKELVKKKTAPPNGTPSIDFPVYARRLDIVKIMKKIKAKISRYLKKWMRNIEKSTG